MYLKLQRQPPEGEWLRGKLYNLTSNSASGLTSDSKAVYICDTLERTSKSIQPLIYPVQVTMSPKFNRLLPLVMNVPGRTGIRIHRGSRPEHSQGCILVTSDVEQSLTQLLLKAQKEHEEIRLEISNFRPDYTDSPCPSHLCAPRNRELD